MGEARAKDVVEQRNEWPPHFGDGKVWNSDCKWAATRQKWTVRGAVGRWGRLALN